MAAAAWLDPELEELASLGSTSSPVASADRAQAGPVGKQRLQATLNSCAGGIKSPHASKVPSDAEKAAESASSDNGQDKEKKKEAKRKKVQDRKKLEKNEKDEYKKGKKENKGG